MEEAVYIETVKKAIKDNGWKSYWDYLCKSNDQRKMLTRLRRTKIGRIAESDYAFSGCEGFWSPNDDFTEIISRVGYTAGLIEDLDEGEATPSEIAVANRWVRDAERMMKIQSQSYY